jgi:hypothetical protein
MNVVIVDICFVKLSPSLSCQVLSTLGNFHFEYSFSTVDCLVVGWY